MQTPWPTFVPLLLCFVSTAPLAAQAVWSVTPTPLAPSARSNHAAAYDFLRRRLVVFSGDVGGSRPADTWELAGATWHSVMPSVSPSGRIGHWMAYDLGRARVVLFGGSTTGGDSGAVNDTWEWDGATWTQRLPAQSPSARWAHAMTADWVNGRVVLFGGRDTASVHQNDTWEFDGAVWLPVQPVGVSPSARWGHRTTYDTPQNQLILNGGITGGHETWQWNGLGWTLLDNTLASQLNTVIHYDWQVGRPTMFGGATWTFGVPSPATVTPFGSACSGPAGTPQLAAVGGGVPSIGQTLTLRASPVSAFALFLFGWSDTASGSIALPYSLAPHGAPGCNVLVSPDAVFGVVGGPAATIPVAVPFAPVLVGLQFFNQAVSFDAGANALGLTVSNGTRATIGWH